ncbi:MerR family transcriptional regulator [Streptomyces sp. NPDC006487]|uniref:MerR family transcriptional regulator n=1 Tax=Streptomyces sp. NPDC006487 TaxID=3364748 RepID=UPI00369EAEB3
MRIGELARSTGVSVATVKYYTREGLLPSGERTSPNQVSDSASHAHRLRLIRAMPEVGGLSIAAVREVLGEVDSPRRTVHGTARRRPVRREPCRGRAGPGGRLDGCRTRRPDLERAPPTDLHGRGACRPGMRRKRWKTAIRIRMVNSGSRPNPGNF